MHMVHPCCFIHSSSLFLIWLKNLFFNKGTGRKYFRLCRPKSKIEDIMWVLLYNFHVSQKIFLLQIFSQTCKNGT